MSGQGSGGAEEAYEVIALVQQLRVDLEALTEGELRRQARLAAFDQQVAQLEGSIRSEVERLRATGTTVEMQTDLLRRAIEDSTGDGGLDGVRDELARLRDELAALPRPDDGAVLGALNGVTQQLSALERSVDSSGDGDALAALAARVADLSDRVQALAVPDLQPVHGHLDELAARIASIPQPAPTDLSPLHNELAQVRDQIARLPVADDEAVLSALGGISERLASLDGAFDAALAPVARREALDQLGHDVRELATRVDGLAPPDVAPHIEPLIERLDTLHARVAAIPARDLRPLHDQLEELRATLASIPTNIPTVDLGPLHARLTDLGDQIAGLPTNIPTVDLGPLHARLTDLGDQIAGLPTDIPTVDIDPLRATFVSELQTLGAEVQLLTEHVGALPRDLPTVDLAPLHNRLAQLRDQIDALPRVDPETLRLEVQAEVQSVREMIAATPVVDLGPVVGRLGALREQLDAVPVTDLGPIEQQIEELRTQVAALPAIDLEPVLARLASLREQITSIPEPDLDTVRLEIQSEAQRVRDLIEALPTVDLTPLQNRIGSSHDTLRSELHAETQRIRELIDALPAPDLDPLRADLHAETQRIRELIDALPTVDLAPIHQRLTADAERLASELQGVRDLIGALPEPDLEALRTELRNDAQRVVDLIDAIPAVDLTPLHDHLTDDTDRLAAEVGRIRDQISSLPRPNDAAVRAAIAEVSEQLTDARQAIEALPQPELIHALALAVVRLGERIDTLRDQVAAAPDHTDAIDGLHAAVQTLGAQSEAATTAVRSLEAGSARGFAAAQQAAVEHSTALTSTVDASVEALRSSLVAEVAAAKQETIRELDERLLGRIRASEGRIEAALAAIGERLDQLPLPDLGPVATQLARLSATVTSQTRIQPAGAEELDHLGKALTASLAAALERLDQQGTITTRMADAIDAMPNGTAEQAKALHEALDRRYEETAAALAVLTLELAETRALVEQRGGRRRRGSRDDVPALPVHVFQQTLAENMQRELDAMKGHITVLGDRVERALAAPPTAPARSPLRATPARPTPAEAPATTAEPAVATPTAEAEVEPPQPAAAPSDDTPAEPTPASEPPAAKAATSKRTSAKKAATKPAPTKKTAAKRKTTTKKASPKRKAATKKKATAKRKAAPKPDESPES